MILAECLTTDMWIKIITPIVTVGGILVGIWQFIKSKRNLQNKELEQRKFEMEKMLLNNESNAIAKFKEFQLAKYTEASEIISRIIYTDNYETEDFKSDVKRFWQLYWVELSSVEDLQVESAMVFLGKHIKTLEEKEFSGVNEEEKKKLRNLGYDVAQAIKKSSRTWEMPGDNALSAQEKQSHLKQLGEKVTAHRESNNWSVEELASDVGISEGQLLRLEAGEYNLNFDTLVALAKAFGVEVKELL